MPENQTEETTTQQPLAASVSQADPTTTPILTKSQRKLFIILGILGVIVLILILGGIFLLTRNSSASTNSTSSTSSISSTASSEASTTSSQVSGVATGKLYFVKQGNIFAYDSNDGTTAQVTNYTNTSASFAGIKVVNTNLLGYAKCDITTGNYNCGIYTFDLTTNTPTTIKTLGSDQDILSFDLASGDLYAYLVTTSTKWELHLVNAGDDTTLSDITIGAYGRGGFDEDSERVAFSPDGKTLLQIATSSPRDSRDFNIYVYPVSTEIETIVTNATQPDWIDNNTFVFHKYTGSIDDGLYIYNVSSSSSQKITAVAADVRDPKVLSASKIMYTLMPDRQVWVYDLNTHAASKLLDHATVGLWLTPTRLVFSDMKKCASADTCNSMDGEYEFVGIKQVDLADLTNTQALNDLDSLYLTATLYNN